MYPTLRLTAATWHDLNCRTAYENNDFNKSFNYFNRNFAFTDSVDKIRQY